MENWKAFGAEGPAWATWIHKKRALKFQLVIYFVIGWNQDKLFYFFSFDNMATHRIRGISMARCKMGIGCVYFVKTFWQTIVPRVKHLVSANFAFRSRG